MTRGKLVLITPDGSYWRSTEFNGDMYPNGGIGDDILKYYDENGVPSLEGFRELVADINKKILDTMKPYL